MLHSFQLAMRQARTPNYTLSYQQHVVILLGTLYFGMLRECAHKRICGAQRRDKSGRFMRKKSAAVNSRARALASFVLGFWVGALSRSHLALSLVLTHLGSIFVRRASQRAH